MDAPPHASAPVDRAGAEELLRTVFADPDDALRRAEDLVASSSDPAVVSIGHQVVGIVLRDRGELPAAYPERAVYVATGTIEVQHQRHGAGRMLVAARGVPLVLAALEPAVVMLLGGEPVGERFVEWNFVSSSRERIEQAKADWRAGRMKLPDLDRGEFIPLPGDPPPPPEPMS